MRCNEIDILACYIFFVLFDYSFVSLSKLETCIAYVSHARSIGQPNKN